jgi:hypothetical protein
VLLCIASSSIVATSMCVRMSWCVCSIALSRFYLVHGVGRPHRVASVLVWVDAGFWMVYRGMRFVVAVEVVCLRVCVPDMCYAKST